MSSSWNSPWKNLGPRLMLWFGLAVVVSVTAVSATVYFLLSASLRRADHEFIEARSLDYVQVYQRSGLDGLKAVVAEQRREDREDELLVSLEDAQNKEIFTYMPSFLDHDEEDPEELEQVKRDAANLELKPGWKSILIYSNDGTVGEAIESWTRQFVLAREWHNVLPLIDHDLFEIHVVKITPELWMKIGKNPEFREDHLMRVRNIGLMVMVPFLFLSSLVGLVAIWRLLAPVRGMMETISQLQSGDRTARAPLSGRGDELDRLGQQFNALLDSNAKLVDGMRLTLDNVAHDLRTPLTRFRTGAEMALQNLQDTELTREALETGIENTEAISALLDAIMDVAQVEAGTIKLKRTPVSLKELCERVVDLYQYVAEERGIGLSLAAEHDVQVEGDAVRLAQCLSHLVDNALKYSPSETQVQLQLLHLSSEVEIRVTDQGPGISPHDQTRIFDKLYRADHSRSTAGLGLGLGLARAIAHAHGGKLLLTNSNSAGSSFSLFLPISL